MSVRNCGERGRKSKGRVPDNLSTRETSLPLNPEPQRALPLNEMKRLTLRRKYVNRDRERERERDKKKKRGKEKFVRQGKGRADAERPEEKGVLRARSFLS